MSITNLAIQRRRLRELWAAVPEATEIKPDSLTNFTTFWVTVTNKRYNWIRKLEDAGFVVTRVIPSGDSIIAQAFTVSKEKMLAAMGFGC